MKLAFFQISKTPVTNFQKADANGKGILRSTKNYFESEGLFSTMLIYCLQCCLYIKSLACVKDSFLCLHWACSKRFFDIKHIIS